MPSVTFDRKGPSGNIYSILGKASVALKLAGCANNAEAMIRMVKVQDSYEKALEVISEFVDLIDVTSDDE